MSTTGKKNLAEPTLKDNITSYLKGVRVEWGKITWPDKPQVVRETIAVIVVVFFFVLLVSCYDGIFTFLLKFLPGQAT